MHIPNRPAVLALSWCLAVRVRVSQFLSVLLLATVLLLTVCFGVAAWRQSASGDVDITATIPHQDANRRGVLTPIGELKH